jgi:hypothetical protein
MTRRKRQRNRALIDAVLLNDMAEIRRLLADGADVDARDPEHGETALMLTRSEEQEEGRSPIARECSAPRLMSRRSDPPACR